MVNARLAVRRGALIAMDAGALVALRPSPARLAALRAPQAWIARDGVDAVLATLVGSVVWLVAAWLALGLACAGGARLPGAAGAVSRRLCHAVLPRAVRRLLAGAAGFGVLLAPVAAVAHTAPAVPAPAWPVSTAANGPSAPPPSNQAPSAPSRSVPAPQWPSQPAPRSAHDAPPAASAPGTGARPTRVRPGDSLWLIAARRLGGEATPDRIAHYWPRLYAANRAAIGPDPSLITPGLLLQAPTPAAPEGR